MKGDRLTAKEFRAMLAKGLKLESRGGSLRVKDLPGVTARPELEPTRAAESLPLAVPVGLVPEPSADPPRHYKESPWVFYFMLLLTAAMFLFGSFHK